MTDIRAQDVDQPHGKSCAQSEPGASDGSLIRSECDLDEVMKLSDRLRKQACRLRSDQMQLYEGNLSKYLRLRPDEFSHCIGIQYSDSDKAHMPQQDFLAFVHQG